MAARPPIINKPDPKINASLSPKGSVRMPEPGRESISIIEPIIMA